MGWVIAQSLEVTNLNWIQFGVLGLVVLALISGWLWPKPSVDRLLSDLSRQQVQIDELTKTYQEEVIPTLVRANEILTRIAQQVGNSGSSP